MEKKEKRPMHPIWYLIIGIALLVIPTAIYLGFLIPQMREEYIVLMSSGGIVGGAGIVGSSYIPETAKYGTLYKTASKSFSLLVCITLVQDFIGQILGLLCTFAVSYIVFLVMRGIYIDAKQKRSNAELSKQITRGITEAAK